MVAHAFSVPGRDSSRPQTPRRRGRGSPIRLADALVQQEARPLPQRCRWRPGMQEQRVHQDHVAGRRCVLENLERYPIDLFDMLVKPRDPRRRIARRGQIPKVRVPFERFTELCASRFGWRWILLNHRCTNRCDPPKMFTPPPRGPASVSIACILTPQGGES